jgi:phosphatidylserine/phosphatidylglycerophosphate/cardiolipin synthase-like enzyme
MLYLTAFDLPPSDTERQYEFYSKGCSPTIFDKLVGYLKRYENKTVRIYVALYLFNNALLHEEFKLLANKGVEIIVISIPLEGYDKNNAQFIRDENTRQSIYPQKMTKYDLAQRIYSEFTQPDFNQNYKLLVFPHLYVRSSTVRPFSRGNMPYSLHTKSLFIERQDTDKSAVALTSSNLAVRDLRKYETMLIVEGNEEANHSAAAFFHTLIINSIDINSTEAIAPRKLLK